MKEHEIYYVYEELRWQGNWTSVQWPLRISYTDLYLANLLACRSQSLPPKDFIFFCRLKTTTENLWDKCTIKEHWKLKKCTNAWVLDSPPTSKFKTLKKVNSIQFESPTCSSARLGWNGGEAIISFPPLTVMNEEGQPHLYREENATSLRQFHG